jgi:hypothetical protein
VDLIKLTNLLDEAKCYEVIRQLRWPDGVVCLHCRGRKGFARLLDGGAGRLSQLLITPEPNKSQQLSHQGNEMDMTLSLDSVGGEMDPGSETGGYVRVLLLYAAQKQEQ